jgi:hypothetical protein
VQDTAARYFADSLWNWVASQVVSLRSSRAFTACAPLRLSSAFTSHPPLRSKASGTNARCESGILVGRIFERLLFTASQQT